jgi:thiamine-monophosphate kinase
MTEKITPLDTLGEFGLIEELKKNVKQYHPESLLGIGDDAAVIQNGHQHTLLSTDMMVEGIHFDLTYTPLPHLGYKAVATNVSDIAAMNGTPKHIMVSLGLSSKFSLEAVEAIYKGIHAACKDYQVDLVGGDTTTSKTGLIINISIVGTCLEADTVFRNGAKEKDIICVSGDLGAAYIGLQILEREKQVFMANPNNQPDLEDKSYVIERQLKPKARMDVVHELKNLHIKPTSMIDISDGLASELMHVCRASGLGAKIFEDKLPFDPMVEEIANEFNISINTCVLNGGEDYELLFTIQQEDFPKIKNHPDISTIGYMTSSKEGIHLISNLGSQIPITAQGWNHFR